ncbi:MAG: diguanylate cyclase [Candidatus Desulfacyla sp.]
MSTETRKNQILMVDDSPVNVRILVDALQSDYELSVATNGPDALEIAGSRPPPDLILLDIMMPGMDGYEVCRLLKEDDATRDIPIMFVTGKNEDQDETKGLELGAVDYITKPFSIPIVKARIRTHLELKSKRDLLQRLSMTDGLTGIANRRRFDEVLMYEWKRGQRTQRGLSLIMIDIDFFKAFNDHYGHLQGDDCLKMVAETLSRLSMRFTDCLARYGGEEFALILTETPHGGAASLAEKMRTAVEARHIPHAGSPVSDWVTVSVGAASVIPSNDASPLSLIQCADKMLYAAKAGGRNRVEVSVVVEEEG